MKRYSFKSVGSEPKVSTDDKDYIVHINIVPYNKISDEKIVSMIIHEMFHIHQLENIIPLRTSIKKRENNFNQDELLELYSIYCNEDYHMLKGLLRQQKDYNILLIEDLEGTALYVEYKYLKMHQRESENYLELLMKETMDSRKGLIPYIKGLLISLILDKANSEWHKIYNCGEFLIHEILLKTLEDIEKGRIPPQRV